MAAGWQFPAQVMDLATAVTPLWGAVAANVKSHQVYATAGQVSYPYDNKPILGPIPGYDGLYLNAGHSYGVMAAPASGRYVAEMITGERQVTENPFSFERLARQP